jgi:hypothetical protein
MSRDFQWHRILFLALLTPFSAMAADTACTSPADSAKDVPEEPQEVASNARETVSRTNGMRAWLRRLEGRYTLEGYVDPCGSGNIKDQRQVTGKVDCIIVSVVPDVHCKFHVSWPAAGRLKDASSPGHVSNAVPAQFLFSIEHPMILVELPGRVMRIVSTNFFGDGANNLGIVLVQVDNMGVGEFASGVLVDDTFLSNEPCLDIPGDCRRITRFTVNPENTGIFMTLEVRIDRQRVMRQVFTMQRKPDVRKAQ